jgi:hypothetical protein
MKKNIYVWSITLKHKIMKTTIFTAAMIMVSLFSTAQVEATNKFLFSSGIENNEWNKSYFGSSLMYFNQVDEDNYNLYVETERVLALYGREFGDYDLDASESDGEIDPIDVIYEKVPFRSQAKVDRTYILGNNLLLKVVISENISWISIYKQ